MGKGNVEQVASSGLERHWAKGDSGKEGKQ